MLRSQWVMLDYGVILVVDYENTLCPLFSQYKGGQISLKLLNLRIFFLIRKFWLRKWLAATSFLQSRKMCCMSKIKGDRIFIQNLHQAMGINSEVRSRQRSHLNLVTSVKNLVILNEIVEWKWCVIVAECQVILSQISNSKCKNHKQMFTWK